MAVAPVQGNWSTGLCDWCAAPGGFGTCLYAMCCLPCAYGSLVERLGNEVTCGGSCMGACCYYTLAYMFGINCVVHAGVRGHLRAKYGIPGDYCNDLMCTCCFAPCAICQETREVMIRNGGQ
ncbi:hypothetical protein HYH02_012450 [Chlamydomonas schloesseri]|uniref:Uncharacterized protein n=1 Tax=Chlamydomonas schloesseri TaxID=2026947 RepID=A0A835SVI8_9CHLO|nr:hypothetical protein HYH02_012450 [Chlamydomonas schloesseri]|eukprot:KAG2433989.1 hypothetical protein HYH02_012450 [Chlamydomonas schloesseri]